MIGLSRRLVVSLASLAAVLAVVGALAAAGGEADAATCQTGGAVGANNANAYNAGYYDGLCGQYVYFGFGYNYNGYCANSAAYARAAGVGTAGTGQCAAGNVYNYYAGGYHSQCRYWEYYNFGFDRNGYCSLANQYVSAGACGACM